MRPSPTTCARPRPDADTCSFRVQFSRVCLAIRSCVTYDGLDRISDNCLARPNHRAQAGAARAAEIPIPERATLSDRVLSGRSILIAEDDYFWADELRRGVQGAGAIVLGPVATVGAALTLVESAAVLDSAILNINLRGEHAYAVADRLIERAVPVLIVTGYDEAALPVRYAGVRRLEKPVGIEAVLRAMRSLLPPS